MDVPFQPEQDSTHGKSKFSVEAPKKPAKSETLGPLGCLLSWGRNTGLLVSKGRKGGDRTFSRVWGQNKGNGFKLKRVDLG